MPQGTVLKNIYAQLELGHELIREATPRYTSYKLTIQGAEPWDGSPASDAIQKVLSGRGKWKQVDVDTALRVSGLERRDVVGKLSEWHDRNSIQLEKGGVLNQYRILRPMPSTAADKEAIIESIYADLESREKQDLDRLDSVVRLLTAETCFTRALADHFGDTLSDEQQDCGHCTWCETKTAVVMGRQLATSFDKKRLDAVCKAVPQRDDARYLARIAYGISSPRVTQAKMGHHAVFGSMEDHNFLVRADCIVTVPE